MKKIILMILLFVNFIYTQVLDEKLYITIQMMDQVGIINTESNQIQETITTELSNEENEISCMNFDNEMMCDITDGCEWIMGMCMEDSLEDCMDYSTEMECSMVSNCMWMNDHCMDSSDSCMDVDNEMMCNMTNGCEWMMGMCMESMNTSDINTPHFIVMDEELGYWFVTTITSGYVSQYSLIDNQLIDYHFVGDAPAILTIDTINKKIYCSRMMPMNGMGSMMPESESNIIQALDYSPMGLSESIISEYEIGSPAPHGLTINHDGTEIYTASNTTDWIYKINTVTGDILGAVMDTLINNPPNQTIQRLKPIQCLYYKFSSYNIERLFVSCSGGSWYNPFNGETTVMPGALQMWDPNTMQLLNTIEFGDYTGPWHISISPIDNIIYIALSGDNLYETEGLAAVSFDIDNNLELEWISSNPSFDTFHGIDVSSNGEYIYVSGRGDGYIHIFNNNGIYLDNIYTGGMSMLGGICITKAGLPNLGDSNNDGIINVIDIVKIVNYIIGNTMMFSPYEIYSSDLTLDSIIDISDIINIINIITD